MIQSRGKGEYGFDPSELADVTLVCFAMAEHFGINLIEEMRKKTEFNEKRP
jgi:NTP pyrophosphatase (non-canonical NTP hydrolase)